MKYVLTAICINVPASIAMAGGVILARAGINDWQWCLLFGLLAVRVPTTEPQP